MEPRRKKIVARTIIAVLFGLDVLVYIAAKLDFFRRYDPHHVGSYLRGHIIYWAVMIALALLVGLIERLFPEKPEGRNRV